MTYILSYIYSISEKKLCFRKDRASSLNKTGKFVDIQLDLLL